MKLICGKPNMSVDYMTGKRVLILPIEKESRKAAEEVINEGNDKNTVEVKKWRKKRSLDANAYMWVLVGKLAESQGASPIEIYRKAIKEMGIYRDVELPEKDAKTFKIAWENQGLGWLAEQVDFKDDRVLMRFYYGSSRYNTKQMSRLIDGVVQDCEALGIETKTPDEIANLLSQWEEAGKWKNGK